MVHLEIHHQKKGGFGRTKGPNLSNIRTTLVDLLSNNDSILLQELMEHKVCIMSVSEHPLRCTFELIAGETETDIHKRVTDGTFEKIIRQNAVKKLSSKDSNFDVRLKLQETSQQDVSPTSSSSTVRERERLGGRASVVSTLLFNIIKNKEFTTYDFFEKLVRYKDDVTLSGLHSEEDRFNLLHAIIVNNRLQLLLPLVHLHLWGILMQDSVPFDSPSSFRGHTPKQIAESKRARRYREDVAKHERLVNSMSKLLNACHDGDKAAVTRLLNQQSQILHERDSMKNNCLYWSIVSGNLDLFTYLLDQGAEHNNLNENKENLLHVACKLGHSQFINVLMTRCKVDVTASCSEKRTPLERVAENGDVDSLKALLKCGVLLTSCVLPFAAANGRLTFIKLV